VRSEFLQFVFCLIALVLGGAAEELLPKFCGVGFPVLMALTAVVAVRKPAPAMVLFALAAGAFEDALSSLPTMTSPCLFLAVAVLAHKTRFAKTALIAAYPLYQLWLKFIVPGLSGSLGTRFLVAFLIAAVTVFAVELLWAWTERKAALDEA